MINKKELEAKYNHHEVEKGKYDKACMLAMCMNNGRRKAELPRMKVSSAP